MDYLPPLPKLLRAEERVRKREGTEERESVGENREIGMQAFVHGRAKIGESIG